MKLKSIFCSFFILLSVNLFSQPCTLANYLTAFRIPTTAYPYFSVGSGVTVSVSTNCITYADFSYPCGGTPYSGSNPAWGLTLATHYIRFTFSAPVTNLTVLVNGTNQTETFFFAAATGAITLSNYCTPDYSAAGASVTDNAVPANGSIITVNNIIGSTTYTMTHNGLGAGSRMTLLDCIVATLPLPVELVSFTAECINKNTAKLEWKTSQETDNNFFTIERSKDGINWDEIKKIQGGETKSPESMYSYIDKFLGGEQYYYRLRQTDLNGHYKHSNPVVVSGCDQMNDEVLIYPNPAKTEITVIGNELSEIQIFDGMGREMKKEKVTNHKEFKMNIENLEPGIYFIKSGEKNYKLIKE